MTASPSGLQGTGVDGLMFAPCSHAPGLLGWLEATLKPLPFAMCFSAAEERPGGILALPNGFLKTFVAQRYACELERYAVSVGLARVEIVVDPTVSATTADEHLPARRREERPRPVREQPPGLTTRFFAERGYWLLSPLAPGRTPLRPPLPPFTAIPCSHNRREIEPLEAARRLSTRQMRGFIAQAWTLCVPVDLDAPARVGLDSVRPCVVVGRDWRSSAAGTE